MATTDIIVTHAGWEEVEVSSTQTYCYAWKKLLNKENQVRWMFRLSGSQTLLAMKLNSLLTKCAYLRWRKGEKWMGHIWTFFWAFNLNKPIGKIRKWKGPWCSEFMDTNARRYITGYKNSQKEKKVNLWTELLSPTGKLMRKNRWWPPQWSRWDWSETSKMKNGFEAPHVNASTALFCPSLPWTPSDETSTLGPARWAGGNYTLDHFFRVIVNSMLRVAHLL